MISGKIIIWNMRVNLNLDYSHLSQRASFEWHANPARSPESLRKIKGSLSMHSTNVLCNLLGYWLKDQRISEFILIRVLLLCFISIATECFLYLFGIEIGNFNLICFTIQIINHPLLHYFCKKKNYSRIMPCICAQTILLVNPGRFIL